MEALTEIISDFFNSIGQKEKSSRRTYVVRIAPESGHGYALYEHTP
jgi:hypothetical protein